MSNNSSEITVHQAAVDSYEVARATLDELHADELRGVGDNSSHFSRNGIAINTISTDVKLPGAGIDNVRDKTTKTTTMHFPHGSMQMTAVTHSSETLASGSTDETRSSVSARVSKTHTDLTRGYREDYVHNFKNPSAAVIITKLAAKRAKTNSGV